MTRGLSSVLVLLMSMLLIPAAPTQAKERMSAAHAKAIRECNKLVSGLRQRTWGKTEFTRYRVCMAQRNAGE